MQAGAPEAFQIMFAFRLIPNGHMRRDPGERDIRLRALEFEQCGTGHIVPACHPGGRRQHPVTSHEIVALPDALARETYRFIVVAADKMGISRDAAKNRREWIARRQLQRALCRRTAFLPASTIRQGQAVVALGQLEIWI